MTKWRAFSLYGLIVIIAISAGVMIMCGGGSSKGTTPNIILITIDSLRADHLEVYGYNRSTSPRMARFASGAITYKHAVSQASWTMPSIASILTSLYPSSHGAITAKSCLPEDIPTLAEILRDNGYYTIGVVSVRLINRKHGFHRGFLKYNESMIKNHDVKTSTGITNKSLKLLGKAEKQPIFLWVHYFDPHYSYMRHEEYGFASGYEGELPTTLSVKTVNKRLKKRLLTETDVRYVSDVYDEEIAHTDREIGRLLEGIEKLGLKGPTIKIITADHGDYFKDRGRFFHGRDVYDALVHVPLFIGGDIPGKLRGHTVERSVELISIPTTIMNFAHIDKHPFKGEDLIAAALGKTPSGFCFTEGNYAGGKDRRKRAVVYKGWKLIYNIDPKKYELYNLSSDPRELLDLWTSKEPEAARMRSTLKPRLDEFGKRKKRIAPKVKFSKKQKKQLRSLGYLN